LKTANSDGTSNNKAPRVTVITALGAVFCTAESPLKTGQKKINNLKIPLDNYAIVYYNYINSRANRCKMGGEAIMKKQIPAGIVFLCGFLTLFANFIASELGLLIPRTLFSGLESASPTVINTVGLLTVVPLTLLLSWGIMYFALFRRHFPDLYEPSENNKLWLKKAAILILPGEAVRFTACLTTLGFPDSTGKLASLATSLFEMTYLKWFNRFYSIRQLNEPVFADYVGYTVCYLIYLLVYLFGIFFICKAVWKRAKEDYDDLIRPSNK